MQNSSELPLLLFSRFPGRLRGRDIELPLPGFGRVIIIVAAMWGVGMRVVKIEIIGIIVVRIIVWIPVKPRINGGIIIYRHF